MKPARHGRAGVAIAVAIVAHLVALAILVLAVPVLPLPTARFSPDIAVELERSLHPRERPTTGGATRIASPKASTSLRQAQKPTEPTALTPTPPPAPAAAPSASIAASASSPAAGRDWTVRPTVGDLGRSLAGLGGGCGRYATLTTAEQAACDRRVAGLHSEETPHVDAIPAEKRAYYDAVVQQREHGRYAAFKELHDMQLARGPGGMKSHGIDINASYRCSLKIGPAAKETNAAAGKKLGFPPCPIRLPGVDPPAP